MAQRDYVVLLHHTVTVTGLECTFEAQSLHSMGPMRLLDRRVSLRMHPGLRRSRKLQLSERNWCNAHVRHRLRTIKLPTSTIAPQTAKPDPCPPNAVLQSTNNTSLVQIAPPTADKKTDAPLKQEQQQQLQLPNGLLLLSADSGPQETVAWLTGNRFDKYLDTFCSFSGADMLRMNRDDLIQICGQADGIRLYNSLHLKSIAPKLKIYVCRDKSSVFNAIFLSSYNNLELLEKLGKMLGIAPSNIRDIYMEGPQNIHIQLTNDVLGHVKEETMFNVEIIAGNSGSYVLLLKQTNAK